MINQYPLWKYLLILFVLAVGVLYSLPNLYGKDPAVLVSPLRSQELTQEEQESVTQALKQEKIETIGQDFVNGKLLVRFADTEIQLKAAEVLQRTLQDRFVIALNLAPATPSWLRAINGQPMYLGLDLQGGINFLMEVDMDAAIAKEEERYIGDIKSLLRDRTIRHLGVTRDSRGIKIRFRNLESKENAREAITSIHRDLVVNDTEDSEQRNELHLSLSEAQKLEVRKFALQQNITTLRNRVNELGVAEPVIQQQGDRRIIVQLPGVQDPGQAKKILGATATLEVHLVDDRNRGIADIMSSGHAPAGTKIYRMRDNTPVLLQKRVVLTGEYITHAASGIDQRSSTPAVFINLDDKGGRRFSDFTKEHVKDSLAVVYIETKVDTRLVDGKSVKVKKRIEEVISVAVIQERLGKRFQISGLDSTSEAHNLAILLRAGSLAAPVEIIEERTVGPSLGKDNIAQGFQSVVIGLIFVVLFMAVYYKVFGMIANLALAVNIVVIVALLSILQATLTLPGIAGIVLTVGMAVDANVLIFERIREEIRNGNTPQASIHAGYEKAFSTIADANITTLIAAVVLFSFGSGPIKGFAVTLSLGIMTSMFTAIMGTRALVNLLYGGKKVAKLKI